LSADRSIGDDRPAPDRLPTKDNYIMTSQNMALRVSSPRLAGRRIKQSVS